MTNPMRRRRFALAAGLAVAGALAGCASPYGQNMMFGGYREKQLDATHWLVQYDGNGHTPREQVWSYWMHRCAEVTRQNGYEYFALLPESWTPPAADAQASAHPAAWFGDGRARVVQARSGGSVPSYIYVPGQTITTWHTRQVVAMFKSPVPPETLLVLDARSVLEDLGPYVRGTVQQPIDRQALFARAMRWVNASGGVMPPMALPPAPAAASAPAVFQTRRGADDFARHGVAS